MPNTPFENSHALDFLKRHGILTANNKKESDVIVASRVMDLFPFSLRKKLLVWTHEPRFDTHFRNKIDLYKIIQDIHIMNAYTGDICLNNYTLYGNAIDKPIELLDSNNFKEFKSKRIVILASCGKKSNKLVRNGVDIDLSYLRSKIAITGYKLGKIDICGPNWPPKIKVIENSRSGDGHSRKIEILKKYHFNLCFENTNIGYYCTEKIWDSITGGCLPIYYGKGNKIYEDFPENSFLDYSNFRNSYQLFEYIDSMEVDEFRGRMNLCIGVYNKIIEKKERKELDRNYETLLMNIVHKLTQITKKTQ